MTQPMIDSRGQPWFQEYKAGNLPSRSPDTELIRTCHSLTIIEMHDAARYYLAYGEAVAQPPDRVLLLCVAHDTVVFGSDADWTIPERWAQTPETWCEGCRDKVIVAPRVPEQVFVTGLVPSHTPEVPVEEPEAVEVAAPVPVAEAPPLPEPVVEEPPLPPPEPPVEPYEPPDEPPPPPIPDPVPFVEPLPVVDPPPPEPEPYYLPPILEEEADDAGSQIIDASMLEASAHEPSADVSFSPQAVVAPEPPKLVKVERKPMPSEVAAPVVEACTTIRDRVKQLEDEIEILKNEASEILATLSAYSPSFELKGQWYMVVNKGGKYHLSFLQKKPGRPTLGSKGAET